MAVAWRDTLSLLAAVKEGWQLATTWRDQSISSRGKMAGSSGPSCLTPASIPNSLASYGDCGPGVVRPNTPTRPNEFPNLARKWQTQPSQFPLARVKKRNS